MRPTADRRSSSYPLRALLAPVLRALLGKRADRTAELEQALRWARPAPRTLNTDRIPRDGAFITIYNHYDRRGLGAWWGPFVIADAIFRARPSETDRLRIVVTAEWPYPVVKTLTRHLFRRLADAYGLILLPPVEANYRMQSALSIRRVLSLTRVERPPLIIISPEGKSLPNLALHAPPAGAGVFLKMLSNEVLQFLPAGIYEDDDEALTVSFGLPFRPDTPRGLGRAELDRAIGRQLMLALGRLVPERMWGEYRGGLERTGQGNQSPGAECS